MKKVKLLFFTTPSCSMCKVIKDKIEKGEYDSLDISIVNIVNSEDYSICAKHRVRAFPSVVNEETEQVIVGQTNCLQYLEELK